MTQPSPAWEGDSDAGSRMVESSEEDRAKAAIAIAKTVPGSRKKVDTKLNLNGLKLADLPDYIERSHADSINLSNNHFAAIPYPLTEIINLTRLDLSKNKITEIPEELSKLVNLSVLDLSSNRLKEIPEVISELAKLQSLKLDENEINTISGHISELVDLNELSVASNNLQALAPEIGAMPNLRKIDLSDNPGLGNIPPEWEQLLVYVLNHLNLKNTGASELPYLEKHPVHLKTLNLEDNREMRTLPTALGPVLQSRDPDRITTTKKGRRIDIHTRGTYLIPALASDGRVQIKHDTRIIPAGKPLPSALLQTMEDTESPSKQNMLGEPPTNDAPPQLAMDQAAVIKKWEEIKQSGAGPADLIGLKQRVDRQNLVTVFAYTYGFLQKAQGVELNIEEFNLSLNAALARMLELPLTEELAGVGALMPLPRHEIEEALMAVKHLTTVSEEQTNFAASQLAPLARHNASLVLTDIELSSKVNEIKEFHGHVTAGEINQVFSLAKGAFRQSLITRIAHIFAHMMSSPHYPLDGVETALIFQNRLATTLELPGNIGEVKLPPNLDNSVTPEEIELVKNLVSALEALDGGSLFNNYLETKPFWKDYVHGLADRLIVADKYLIDIEKHQIDTGNGWTQDYRSLALGLFRQDRLNIVSHMDVYTRDDDKAIDYPKLISLNYQIQLADELGLPGVLREFPKDVAAVICWKIPTQRLESVASAVLEYEQLNDGQLFEDFLNAQDFWQEHLNAKSRLYSNQEAFRKGMKITKTLLERMGIGLPTGRDWV